MTTNLDARKFLVTAAAAVLLAACSGAASPAATATAPTTGTPTASGTPAIPVVTGPTGTPGDQGQTDPACALVTKDEVATAVGFSIATALGAGGTCIFQNVDPSQLFSLQLINGQSNMSLYLSIEDSSEHVAGLGDDAFWQVATATLFVRQGDQALVLIVQSWVMTSDPATDHAHRDSLVTLARIALGNL